MASKLATHLDSSLLALLLILQLAEQVVHLLLQVHHLLLWPLHRLTHLLLLSIELLSVGCDLLLLSATLRRSTSFSIWERLWLQSPAQALLISSTLQMVQLHGNLPCEQSMMVRFCMSLRDVWW